MMFDSIVLNSESVGQVISGFQQWHPQREMLSFVSLVTVFAAIVISRILSAPPMVTLPFSYVLLYALAMFSNYLGRDVFMTGVSDVQKFMCFTMIAHAMGGVILLGIFKGAELRWNN